MNRFKKMSKGETQMNKFNKFKRLVAVMLAIALTIGMIPGNSSRAVSGSQVAKDKAYETTVTVNPDEDEDFDAYELAVKLTVTDGKISALDVENQETIEEDNLTYINKALDGTKKNVGLGEQLVGLSAALDAVADVDAVSKATCTSNALIEAVKTVLTNADAAEEETPGETESETVKETETETETPGETESETETAKETETETETPKETESETQKAVYVMMNIPYKDFYEADLTNDKDVDVVTSATSKKWKTQSGTYYKAAENAETGGTILGVTFPVSVSDLSKLTGTKVENKEDLSAAGNYAYYILDEKPGCYKTLTAASDGSLSFGKVQGDEKKLTSEVTLATESRYGDYQLNVNDLSLGTVYGVVLTANDGTSYGLRHLENIWRGGSQLSWSTGFSTTESHGNTLSYEHYVSMMGKTISRLTYYTSEGICTIDTNLYIPYKFDGSVTVEDTRISAGKTAVKVTGLPDGYEAVYSVKDLEITVKDGMLSFDSSTVAPGRYTLTVSDKNEKYADLSANFILSTTDLPAAYDGVDSDPSLVTAEGYKEADFTAYLGNISSVSVNGKKYSASGKGAVTIINSDGSINVDAAAISRNPDGEQTTSAIFDGGIGTEYEITVSSTGYENDLTFTYTKSDSEYHYVYAGLTWSEYWASEGVYAAGSETSSKELDAKGETDKGAFDTVSRATANHGLHRGSFQMMATIYDTAGETYEVASWSDNATITLTDGSTVGFSRGTITKADGSTATMDHYEVNGIKYVPVKVAAADYEEFCKAYDVVENNGTLAGGYGEQQLQAYTETAKVTKNTNGLKTAVKNEDGSFSFTARAKGAGSGLNTALATASNITVTVKDANGSYGEFLRVDLTGEGYGALGSKMQAVKWTYYGDDSTYSEAIASYGTKFAADNWMHKSNGIQLGLTDSLRCQLPEGTDGTGYWTLTVYALGYEDYTITFKATDENIVDENIAKDTSTYVLMNIPYADFYKADVSNEVAVDVFTSATLNKTRTGTLAGGSYHAKADGSEITGVTFPVKVNENVDLSKFKQVTDADEVAITVTNRGQTSTTIFEGQEALFENESYAYYLLSEEPAYYKEVTANEDGSLSFGAVVGEAETLKGVTAELTTETNYGDYQLNLELPDSVSTSKVYSVIVSTKEGNDYGMRHLENIWRGNELAWSTGFTERVHNCPTSSAHYETMMGQTIDKITYITDSGYYEIPVDDIYVPVKFDGSVEVADADIDAGETTVQVTGLPDDFDAKYAVEGLADAAVADGRLTYSKEAEKGKYTLIVADKSGKYASLRADFILKTKDMPAVYNEDHKSPALIAAEGYSEEAFAGYLKSISTVTVNGTSYSAAGRGAVTIINEDGTLNLEAVTGETSIFGEEGAYEVTVSATGYYDLTFHYTKADSEDPSNEDPSNEEPSNGDPSNEEPSNEAPSNGEPSNEEPSNEVPSNGEPSNEAPSNEVPSNEAPSSNGTAAASNNTTAASNSTTAATNSTTAASNSNSAKTGDSNGMMYLWIFMLALCLGCGGYIVIKRRKDA